MQIQKLGLEIRKIGTLKNLYDDVDLVLNKFQIQTTEINVFAQTAAIAHALNKMLKTENYFSVCTIKDCAKLGQICISKERMNLYQTQHCTDWSTMTNEFRQLLTAMVLDDFRTILNP